MTYGTSETAARTVAISSTAMMQELSLSNSSEVITSNSTFAIKLTDTGQMNAAISNI